MSRTLIHALRHPLHALRYVWAEARHFRTTEHVVSLGRTRVRFSTTDRHSRHWFFPRYGQGRMHEPVTTRLLASMLRKDDVFVDVGAHLGYFTCVGAALLTRGSVYAFEVDAKACALIRKNVALNGFKNVTVMHRGVTNRDGYVRIPKSRVPLPGLSLLSSSDRSASVRVRAVSLDAFFSDGVSPTVVKIDVEGAELLVLEGMDALLRNHALTLFLEIHGNGLAPFGTDSRAIIHFLNTRGYDVFEIFHHRSASADTRKRLRRIRADTILTENTMCLVTPRGARRRRIG